MEGDGDHVCRRMRGGIAAASVANDIYAQVTAPSPYHHSASQQRHCTITAQCIITVPSLYHHCIITVLSLYQCRFYIVFIYVVHIIVFSTYIQIMCNEGVLCGCTSATVVPATVVHVYILVLVQYINNVCDPHCHCCCCNHYC